MRSVYLAGPMRGYVNFNFPAFATAAYELRTRGWEVVSPAEHDIAQGLDPSNPDLEAQGFDVTEAFRWDVQSILDVDAVYFLRGWEASQGATTEHCLAVMLGLERIYEDPKDEQKYYYMPHIALEWSAIDG
jgi:Domain of unknown function (DUF4406)